MAAANNTIASGTSMHASLEAAITKEIDDRLRRFRTPLLQVERGSLSHSAGTLLIVAIRYNWVSALFIVRGSLFCVPVSGTRSS